MPSQNPTTKNDKAGVQGQAGLGGNQMQNVRDNRASGRQVEFDLGSKGASGKASGGKAGGGQSSGKPKANFLVALIPFIALQIVVILLLEGVLFACGLGEEETFKLDKDLGFVHMPNKRITWRSEGFAQSYFDANGMREPGVTIAKPANTYRVAFLGDSLTESLQVPLNESFSYLLEQQLNQDLKKQNTGLRSAEVVELKKAIGNKNIQVLNFGVSGYATVQEYLLLKKKVLAFQPDLVILCYDTRDMFENWSPPDQVLTNVRPLAIKLDGQKLAVSSNSVTTWMNTPRARFLRQIEWIRQNSRIWGLISAWDLEMSMHNAPYKVITGFITDPKKSFKDAFKACKDYLAQVQNAVQVGKKSLGQAGAPQTKEATAPADKEANLFQTSSNSQLREAASELEKQDQANSAKLASQAAKPATASATGGASTPGTTSTGTTPTTGSPTTQSSGQSAATSNKQNNGSNRYGTLVAGTLEALFQEMDKECRAHSAKFAVVLMPSRAALVESSGMETSFFDIDFNQEISMIDKMCKQSNIPVLNTMITAEMLPQDQRAPLFYTAHLTPVGQKFVAEDMQPFVAALISGKFEAPVGGMSAELDKLNKARLDKALWMSGVISLHESAHGAMSMPEPMPARGIMPIKKKGSERNP